MLPNIEIIGDLTVGLDNEVKENNETYALNFNDNFVTGNVDGLEALKQSIYLLLNVEADQYIIYSYKYGLKTVDLIGKPSYYVMAVIPNRIKEALLSDDRITDVTDFEFEVKKNTVTVKFVVHTIYGDVKEETAVKF